MNAPPSARPPEGDWLGTPYLRFERRGALAACVVNRPTARNAMTVAMYFGIRVAIDLVDNDESLAGLLVTGTGDVFIPGGDLGGAADPTEYTAVSAVLGQENTPYDALRQARKPVVCAINGLCQGGGLMIAMLSDVAVTSDRATFRVPELYRGIADTNFAHVLARQIGTARARDLMMTGRTLTAGEAVDFGLIARVVPHNDLSAAASDVLAACCRTAPHARLEVKRTFDSYYGLYDRIGMTASYHHPEALEGFEAFKERRSPDWVHPDLRTDGRL